MEPTPTAPTASWPTAIHSGVVIVCLPSGVGCSGPAGCPFDEDPERFALLSERFALLSEHFALLSERVALLAERVALLAEHFHRFPVPGVFALLALVSGPAHLPDAEPYGAYADGSDRKLADGYPFRCGHGASPFRGRVLRSGPLSVR